MLLTAEKVCMSVETRDTLLHTQLQPMPGLKKQDLKKPDKIPQNCVHTPSMLDGQIDMDLSFDRKARS